MASAHSKHERRIPCGIEGSPALHPIPSATRHNRAAVRSYPNEPKSPRRPVTSVARCKASACRWDSNVRSLHRTRVIGRCPRQTVHAVDFHASRLRENAVVNSDQNGQYTSLLSRIACFKKLLRRSPVENIAWSIHPVACFRFVTECLQSANPNGICVRMREFRRHLFGLNRVQQRQPTP